MSCDLAVKWVISMVVALIRNYLARAYFYFFFEARKGHTKSALVAGPRILEKKFYQKF